MFAEIDSSLTDRWYRLGTRIRCALEPDEPRLVEQYLCEARYLAAWEPVPAWRLFEKCFQLLLDSSRDIALPWHWRVLCLDHAISLYANCNAWRPLPPSANACACSAGGWRSRR